MGEALLNCPACGEPCKGVPARRPRSPRFPEPWWEEGMCGVCQCGAEVIVDADGDRAWLEEYTNG